MNKIVSSMVAVLAIVATPWLFGPDTGIADAGLALAAEDRRAELPQPGPGQAVAIFAGGCFWCMEKPFDDLEGVSSTTSGYTAGTSADPTYRSTSSGDTGHTEAVQVIYDPAKLSYEALLDVFWVNHDPTVSDRQFCDRGSQYRPGIYPLDSAQQQAAEASRKKLQEQKPFDAPILTEIVPATRFYAAEVYHQDYYLKNPLRYNYYRAACGRDARLKELWGDRTAAH